MRWQNVFGRVCSRESPAFSIKHWHGMPPREGAALRDGLALGLRRPAGDLDGGGVAGAAGPSGARTLSGGGGRIGA